jgi:N-methylhydantoinase B
VLGDVRAQLAACAAGEKGQLSLIGRYGAERFRACSNALLDQAERLARNAIRATPDGSYAFEDWIDDDGIDPGPIPIRVMITVAGDRLVADFTGSAPQVKGAINSPLPFTKSAVYACVRHLIGGDPPNNEGYFRPIEVVAPAGTIVNPVMPAPVAARGLTGFRAANALFGTPGSVLAVTTPTDGRLSSWSSCSGLGAGARPRTGSTRRRALSSISRTTR